MKILMLGWELPPHNSGGLGTACLNLCHALSKKDIDIDFVVPYSAKHENVDYMNILDATPIDPLFRFGCGAYDSRDFSLEDTSTHLKKNSAITIRDIQEKYCDYVNSYLDTHAVDCIHAHDWLTFEAGLRAKKKFGVPLVVHVHATEFDRSGDMEGNPLVIEIERQGLLLADRIFAVSEATKNSIHKHYGIPLDKIEVAYNALDEDFTDKTYRLDKSKYHYLSTLKKEGYRLITTVGRFTIQKGLKNYLQAAAIASKWNKKLFFIMAGDGEEKPELISYVASLGLSDRVLFTGFIRGQELMDIYSLSDTFIMSSISEPFGLTALEAARFDNNLILTKTSGVAEVLHSALVYDYWDIKKLANQILSLSFSPTLSEYLKKSLKNEYSSLSWDIAAEKCIKTYKSLIK